MLPIDYPGRLIFIRKVQIAELNVGRLVIFFLIKPALFFEVNQDVCWEESPIANEFADGF